MKKSILNLKNKTVGDINLDSSIFGIKMLPDLIHQYIRYQNAKSRQGSHFLKKEPEMLDRVVINHLILEVEQSLWDQ